MVNPEDDRSGALLIDPDEREAALVMLRKTLSAVMPISAVFYTDRANVYEETIGACGNLSKVSGLSYVVVHGQRKHYDYVGYWEGPDWDVAVVNNIHRKGDDRATFRSVHGYNVECVWRFVP